MESGINFGGYDIHAINDAKAINYLSRMLLDTGYIMPYLETGDKRPNFDGRIEILVDFQRKKVSQGCFDVQVKSLNHDYQNDNKELKREYAYKYSCETKAMNGVLLGVTCNPVLLFLVDYHANKIFWIYLSMEYCLGLNIGACGHKTIYFNDCNEIAHYDNWVLELKDIYCENRQMLQTPQKNSFLLSSNCQKVPIEVQAQFDYLNNLLDHELWFIKDYYFPDTWKLGIAYLESDEAGYSCMGIYRIKCGENDLFIKAFDEDSEDCFVKALYGGNYILKDMIQSSLEHLIDKFFERGKYWLGLLPDIALLEILFENIDEYLAVTAMKSRTQGQYDIVLGYPKDRMSIGDAKSIMNRMDETEVPLACLNELEKRGYRVLERAWEHLCDYHVEKEDEYCTSFKEDGDRAQQDRHNMVRFLNGFMAFNADMVQRFGEKSRPVLDLKNHYMLSLSADFSSFHYLVVEANRFQLEWKLKREDKDWCQCVKEAWKPPVQGYVQSGSARLFCNDCSWYKLWRIFCKNRFLIYIGKNQKSIVTDYIASM